MQTFLQQLNKWYIWLTTQCQCEHCSTVPASTKKGEQGATNTVNSINMHEHFPSNNAMVIHSCQVHMLYVGSIEITSQCVRELFLSLPLMQHDTPHLTNTSKTKNWPKPKPSKISHLLRKSVNLSCFRKFSETCAKFQAVVAYQGYLF